MTYCCRCCCFYFKSRGNATLGAISCGECSCLRIAVAEAEIFRKSICTIFPKSEDREKSGKKSCIQITRKPERYMDSLRSFKPPPRLSISSRNLARVDIRLGKGRRFNSPPLRLSFSRPLRPSPSDSRVIECTIIPTEQTTTGLSSSIRRPRGRYARIESLRSLRSEASSRSLRNTRQDASMRARANLQ